MKVERDISQTCLFLVLVSKTALFAAEISSSENVAKKDGRSINISWGSLACMKFFHLLFPCANILFVLRPPPPAPISFLMVRPLKQVPQNRFGTYLVHIKFLILKCHSPGY